MTSTWKSDLSRGLAHAAMLAFLGLAGTMLLAPAASPALAQAQPQQTQGVASDVRAVLSQYGKFVQHQKYGEVWVPGVTPQGWHPYPPCHWVFTKQMGWYFDDKTPWGQIVHHYGRWSNDPQMGWIWVPDSQFSPGWVVWRTDQKWIGWAPMPDELDVQLISTDQFNNGSQWIFMEIAKMRSGCSDRVVAGVGMVPLLIRQTRYITEIEYLDGIAVFVLPPYIVGPIIDINFIFDPWPAWFFAQLIIDWNWLWTNTNIVININNPCGPSCPPGQICP